MTKQQLDVTSRKTPATVRHVPAPQPNSTATEPSSEKGWEPLDPAATQSTLATVRGLPGPDLEGVAKAFRKRFPVPAEAASTIDRICQRRHHDWIQVFMVQHRAVL